MKIPEKCKFCKYKATDACRDSWWWICTHDKHEVGEEPSIDIEKAPPQTCPLREYD